MSTFHGLEMAKQALSAQQSGLYTTGHNISNANTDGYTRQRVNFETASPYASPARNRPEIAGQKGTGVEAGTVQRIRTQFLDHQFRAESSSADYWNSKSDALTQIENLMNEPSESNLSATMNQFWESLQELSVNPDDSGVRSVVAQRANSVAGTFNYLSDSLNAMRKDLREEIDHKKDTANSLIVTANSLIRQINNVNKQVKSIESNGQVANDLYDKRDKLIDELSGIVNIDVNYTKSSENAPDIADGLATIKLADTNGKALNGGTLVEASSDGEFNYNTIEVRYTDSGDAANSVVVHGDNSETGLAASEFAATGSLKGLIESYGYKEDNGDTKGTYPDMLKDLNELAGTFAEKFNDVHNDGADIKEEQGIENFFEFGEGQNKAASMTVNPALLNDPGKIAAGRGDGRGDGSNASQLTDVIEESFTPAYESLIGELGVKTQEANRMAENTDALKSQVEKQRMSVSSVSLDEEMSNMIKFQHAYNAAARSMTAVDEMIDRIINNMGLVGR